MPRKPSEIKQDRSAAVESLRTWHAAQKAAGKIAESETEFQNRKSALFALKKELDDAEAAEAQAGDRDGFLASIESEVNRPGERRTAEEAVMQFDQQNDYRNERTTRNRARRRWANLPNTPEVKALNQYLVAGGKQERLDASTQRVLAAQTASPGATGGVVIPTVLSSRFLEDLEDFTFMLELCPVEAVQGAGSVGYLGYKSDDLEPEWTPELKTVPQGDSEFDRREMQPNLCTKEVVVSRLLMAAVPQAASYVLRRLARKEAVVCESAGMSGTGLKQPLGFFTESTDGVDASRNSQVGTGTDLTLEQWVRFRGKLSSNYRSGAVVVGGEEFASRTWLLTDQNGRPLYLPSTNDEMPDRIHGHRLYESEFAPNAWVAGATVAAIFKPEYYGWVDFFGGRELEPHPLFVRQNKAAWILRFYRDGMPLLAKAFARMVRPA